MISPMLLKLREEVPKGGNYLYEIKMDGQRTIAEVGHGKLLLYTRSLHNVTARYPELQELHKAVKAKSAILDGEIVALKDGLPSFEMMQQRMGLSDLRKLPAVCEAVPVLYYVFDLLALEGKSMLKTPLEERKSLLAKILKTGDTIKLLPFFESSEIATKAKKLGYEGIVAKKRNSTYVPGARTDLWVKVKFVKEDNFVIAGWMEGKRVLNFGALILAVEKRGVLVPAGRVGTGFTEKTIRELLKQFAKLETRKSPFGTAQKFPEAVHWLKPILKARVKFSEITRAGVPRAPVYLGLVNE
jgi:bifunctional non-homologous end joining protein LigD